MSNAARKGKYPMRSSLRLSLLPLILTLSILLTSCGVQATSLNLVPMQPSAPKKLLVKNNPFSACSVR